MLATEPAAAAMVMMRQARLRICRQTHLVLHLGIFFWAMYISTGKYTVSGQNASAPRSPTTSLKNGSSIEMTVVAITKIVLQTSLKRLSL